MDGGNGDDFMRGNAWDDTLAGGEGDDDLHGGKGDDTIGGGEGEDFLRGGSSELDTCFDPNAGTFGRACEIHTANVDNRPAIR